MIKKYCKGIPLYAALMAAALLAHALAVEWDARGVEAQHPTAAPVRHT